MFAGEGRGMLSCTSGFSLHGASSTSSHQSQQAWVLWVRHGPLDGSPLIKKGGLARPRTVAEAAEAG